MKRSFYNLFLIEKEKYLMVDTFFIGKQMLIIIDITEDSMFNPGFPNFLKFGELQGFTFVWFDSYTKMEKELDCFLNATEDNFIVYIDGK